MTPTGLCTTTGIQRLHVGSVIVDFRKMRAFDGDRELALSDREFRVLGCLADRTGAIVSREELLNRVWGYANAPLTRAVDALIFRLRKKIETDPHHPRYLRTAHRDGYRLIVDE